MHLPRFLLLAASMIAVAFGSTRGAEADAGAQEIAPGVFFHEGDMGHTYCNNGWVVFGDHVLVIDANYPGGARIIMPEIAASTDRPVRIVFDTHHHSDHCYANRLWAEKGALIIAQAGVVDELNRVEPGAWKYWEARRDDLGGTSLLKPTVLFDRELVFDDGTQRVELHYFGAGHTKGDGYAWLPDRKVLFTGDACVNGPYNFLGDANVASWIETLEKVKQLGAEIVCPGHGPIGGGEIVVDQQRFLRELYDRVKARRDAGASAAELDEAISAIRAELASIPSIARYVAGGLAGQAEQIWRELGGEPFPK
jgi:cyclase